jgi:serine/threonine protein kinase
VVSPASQRSRFLAPGDKLGKYDLIRQIAVGGMAELYLARTVGIEGFEKLVVVKRILPQYATNTAFVNMFLNEARLAATLHHPNIAQVYDIGQEQGDFFFSMEYVHGEDLGHLVSAASENGVPISLDVALTLGAGLCAGLHHAHEKVGPDGTPLTVVHRDVSPSNVLVSYDGAVKLVDFGIARVSSAPSSTQGGLKGKIAYMSPEQCRGKTALDRRSDIFSIGTILYELTTGQLPFRDETEYAILSMIVNQDAEPPSKLVPEYPPALEAIVMRALARDPAQRYPTALALQGDLEDFAHENRLRVSPLVLARLMSNLFPARLEEWDHARKQGAFFVEQHVVRTLIESGKTGEGPILSQLQPPAEDTAVTHPPVPDDITGITDSRRPLPGLPPEPVVAATPQFQESEASTEGGTSPFAPAPAPRMPTPVPGMPGAVPIYIPTPAPPVPGTLVSNTTPGAPQPALRSGDVTERVHMPAQPVMPGSRRGLVIALAASGALAAAAVTYVVLANDVKLDEKPAPTTEPALPQQPIDPPIDPPIDQPVAAETADAAVAPVPAVEKPPPPAKPAVAAKPKPADKPRARKRVRKPKPAKGTSWNPDSPFMPVPVKK